ncbi:platelet glycoprotein Ib alpha chain-like isoform X1 [Argiope bruennichi]|uniref:platelet glycoprotein Ib alpha chain-like isoform X1 n=1 Tax=Argiope bruennichi TaxID=94029 RepID=UPI002494BB11|nr:platelet glycoprotein Ib alpha chain-like isoform X1 [Argiope bruennichi]
MSMHLKGSSDMMRNEDEGWWTSRTGLEQKLIILSTILFIVCFSLTITVIVYKNRSSSGDSTTAAPPITSTAATSETTVTGDTTPSSDSTVSSSIETSPATSPEASPSTGSPSTPETTSETPSSSTEKVVPPDAEGAVQISKSSPLISLLKEANRVNGILEKLKDDEKLTGA